MNSKTLKEILSDRELLELEVAKDALIYNLEALVTYSKTGELRLARQSSTMLLNNAKKIDIIIQSTLGKEGVY